VLSVCIAIGALLDATACYLGRDLNLYPNEEEEESQKEEEEQDDVEPPPPSQTDQTEVLQPLEQHTGSSTV